MINKDRLFNRLMELGQIGNTADGVYCMAPVSYTHLANG